MEPDLGPVRKTLRKHQDEGLPPPALKRPDLRGEFVLEQVRTLDPGQRG
ncbi:hypothetical protein LINGRAHAP2_LOCUS14237 [Linum grandiflorum]